MIETAHNSKCVWALDHKLGGGAGQYLDHRINQWQKQGFQVCRLGPNDRFAPFPPPALIFVNELLGWVPRWNEVPPLLSRLIELAGQNEAEMHFCFHDYFSICPAYTLVGPGPRYCGLPEDPDYCQKICLPSKPAWAVWSAGFARNQWRDSFQEFFSQCRRLLFFSHSARKTVGKIFDLPPASVRVQPHVLLDDFEGRYEKPAPEEPLTVAVVGSISSASKGSLMVLDLARLMLSEQPEARLVVLGELSGTDLPPNVRVIGPYRREQLPKLLSAAKASIAFVPSICPETFSYVTLELISLGLPVICFDLGGQAEQVSRYPKGATVSTVSAKAAWEAILTMTNRERLRI